MTAGPLPRDARHGLLPSAPNPLVRWSAGLGAAAAAAVVAGVVLFGIAYAVGGTEATEDNWVGLLSATGVLGGLLLAFVAFVLALSARIRHEPWRPLWLPLAVFPGVTLFLAVSEIFWWE